MKSVMISIKPKWCELIASGKKTVEVRKSRPKLETPFKVYIYCTKDKNFTFCTDDGEQHTHIGNGKVIGEFVCDTMTRAVLGDYCILPKSQTCIDELDLLDYADEKTIYGWHISDLVIYDKPRELSEFHTPELPTGLRYEDDAITRPPQSWCYVESEVQGE